MLVHKGSVTLTGKRVVLRRFKEGDGKAMYENWASDKEVTKYLTWDVHGDMQTSEYVVGLWVKEYANPSIYHWAIVYGGEVVGDICAKENAEIAELGWCISRKCQNKGIMTECALLVLEYLFKGVGYERVQAYCHVDNLPSSRVMEKIGMKREGILRKFGRMNDGKRCDIKMYSILKEEYVSAQK